MRQRDDLAFSTFLDDIGDEYLHDSVDLARLQHTRSPQEFIDFVFPPSIVSDPQSAFPGQYSARSTFSLTNSIAQFSETSRDAHTALSAAILLKTMQAALAMASSLIQNF
jgi:hypothetical protein